MYLSEYIAESLHNIIIYREMELQLLTHLLQLRYF